MQGHNSGGTINSRTAAARYFTRLKHGRKHILLLPTEPRVGGSAGLERGAGSSYSITRKWVWGGSTG